MIFAAFQEPAAPIERPALVVLAPFAWLEDLAPLAAARSEALRVELTAIEDVVNSPLAGDPPERIKRHLFAAWKERGARYALLAGDADVLPVRFMVLDRWTPAAANFAFYASDHYYADVADSAGAFDDWNEHVEGPFARYFGEVRGETIKTSSINEDDISYAPELAVGRWPVSDRAALRAIVAKTLAWRPGEAKSALWVHADGWIDERERVRGAASALGAGGFEPAFELFGGERPAPTRASVLEAWNGGVRIVFHLGHGSPGGWEGCLATADLAALRERPASIVLSAGCNTAEFCVEPPYHAYLDESGAQHRGTNAGETFSAPPPPPAWLQPGSYNLSGIGEELVRLPTGGAVVYIGCGTGAQPCAVTLLEGFARSAAKASTARAGDAWREAVAHYHEAEKLAELKPDEGWYPPAIFFQAQKFLYFGDPSLPLR